MMPPSLPPHIAKHLGKPQLREACLATVAAAEAHGLRMRVVRVTLGDPKTPEWNTSKIVYETPKRSRTA